MQQATRDHQSCIRVRLTRLSRLRMGTKVGHELSRPANKLSSRLITEPVLGFACRVYGVLHVGFLIFVFRLLTDKRSHRLPYRLDAQPPLPFAEPSQSL